MGRPLAGLPVEPSPAHLLLKEAAKGDRRAQQSLLLREVPRIRRRIARLVADRGEHDDLAQIACMELIASLGRYRGDASFALWVDRITTRVVLKHFRTCERRRRKHWLAAHLGLGRSEDPSSQLEWREALDPARALLEELTAERRLVYLLVAVEGRTIAETAAMLDLSLPAAKSRYLRARRDVEDRLSSCPELQSLLSQPGEEDV